MDGTWLPSLPSPHAPLTVVLVCNVTLAEGRERWYARASPVTHLAICQSLRHHDTPTQHLSPALLACYDEASIETLRTACAGRGIP